MKNIFRRSRGGQGVLLASLLLVLLGFGCSSNEFGPTGSDLPADVSQDSLAIPLEVNGTTQEQRLDLPLLDPPQGAPLDQREFLYFGTRANVGLKATPFIRYDFADIRQSALDSLQADPGLITDISITLRVGRYDKNQAIHVGIYELSSPLDSTMVNDPIADHLGEELGEYLSLGGQTHVIDLLEGKDPAEALVLKQKVIGWMLAGEHDGLAFVDLDGDTPLVTMTSRDFNFATHEFLLWEKRPDVDFTTLVLRPIFTVNYCKGCDPDGNKDFGFILDSKRDLTVFERTMPVSNLVLGSHLARRVWLSFDLSSIPRAATVNSAQLVLHIDKDQVVTGGLPGQQTSIPDSPTTDESNRATGDRTFDNSTLTPINLSALVYEATPAQVQELDTTGLPQVLDALTTLRPDVILSGTEENDDQLRINIADYAQRLVNGIFGSEPPGLLVTFANEQLQLLQVPFFDSTASDSLRPRVEIRFTPPADFGD